MTGEGGLSESEVYDILRNDRRRYVIEYLRNDGGATTVGDLADLLAADEAGETPPPRNVRQSVYVSLHQTHLPRLDQAGVLRYDGDSKRVELLDGAEAVTAYLELLETDVSAGHRRYAMLAAGGVLAVAMTGLLTPGVESLVPTLVGSVFLAVIAATAAYYAVTERDRSFDNYR